MSEPYGHSRPTALYRLYSADGELLYVGIAFDAGRRFVRHQDDKDWWPLVARVAVEHLPNRPSALEAEERAIRTEGPRFNVKHNSGRSRGQARPAKRPTLWHYESRDGRHRVTSRLWLEPELHAITVLDDCEMDGVAALELAGIWVRHIRSTHPEMYEADAVPITWLVGTPHGIELAPARNWRALPPPTSRVDETFLHKFTTPMSGRGKLFDWDKAPVEYGEFYGDIIVSGLGWQPAPRAATCPIRTLAVAAGI